MIGKAHEGHLGIAKTKARAREHMWWPGMARALEEAVIRCPICAQFRHQQQKEPLMTTQLPERPWQQVGLDLFEWEGKHYLLVVDYYSRFPEIRLLKHQGATAVIAECRQIFSIPRKPARKYRCLAGTVTDGEKDPDTTTDAAVKIGPGSDEPRGNCQKRSSE